MGEGGMIDYQVKFQELDNNGGYDWMYEGITKEGAYKITVYAMNSDGSNPQTLCPRRIADFQCWELSPVNMSLRYGGNYNAFEKKSL